jgi:hypothetical protein
MVNVIKKSMILLALMTGYSFQTLQAMEDPRGQKRKDPEVRKTRVALPLTNKKFPSLKELSTQVALKDSIKRKKDFALYRNLPAELQEYMQDKARRASDSKDQESLFHKMTTLSEFENLKLLGLVNDWELDTRTNNKGQNVICALTARGQDEIAQELIEEYSTSLNFDDDAFGFSALHYSLMRGNILLAVRIMRTIIQNKKMDQLNDV